MKHISESIALSKMAAYCSGAERAEYDVRRKLQKLNFDNEAIDRIISRLIEENFLNEERYCKGFINDKIRLNKWGKEKIIYELNKKQVQESVIHNCFSKIDGADFEISLMNLLKVKMKTIKARNEYEKRMKLIRFGLSRGFSADISQKCVSELLNSNDDEYTESFS